MIIVLIGPPGAGKGTQGRFLAQKLQLPHLSVGDLLRSIIKEDNNEGIKLKEYVDNGKLTPPELINSIIHQELKKKIYNHGCILDGYPRTRGQAEFLDKITGTPIKIVLLQIDDQLAQDRILTRFSCTECSSIFNSNFDDSSGICPICRRGKMMTRHDDNAETAINRIKIYREEIAPIIEYYSGRDKDSVIMIDASLNVQKVGEELIKLLKKV